MGSLRSALGVIPFISILFTVLHFYIMQKYDLLLEEGEPIFLNIYLTIKYPQFTVYGIEPILPSGFEESVPTGYLFVV